MKENHHNCIYMYTNKVNGKRYIGQAKDFNRRHKAHILKSANKTLIDRSFNKYGEENFEIKILAENIPTQEKMNEYEKFFIKRYNTLIKNGMGYNISDGGSNGNPLAGKTEEEIEEFRRKISKVTKGENNPMYGKHFSEEYKKKLSEAHKGKYPTEKTKQKMSKSQKGRRHSEETKQKIGEANSIKVAQYDKKTNQLIKIWNSINEIERELGINHANIVTCCKWYKCGCNKEEWFKVHNEYPRKTVGGFIWKYIQEVE